MKFRKRHDTTDTADFCPRQLVTTLLRTCRLCCELVVDLLGEVANLLRTFYRKTVGLNRFLLLFTFRQHDRYLMTSWKRGLCIIISNERFMPESHFNRRVGAQNDVEMLDKVFTKLGFDIRQHRDVTSSKAVQVLVEGW